MKLRRLVPGLLAGLLLGCAGGPIVVTRALESSTEQGVPYSLPITMVTVVTSVTKDAQENYTVTLTVEAALVPDPDARLMLVHRESALHKDDVKVELTKSGLLTGVNATSTDQTGAFARSVAEAILTTRFLADPNAKILAVKVDQLLGKRTYTCALASLEAEAPLGNGATLRFSIDGKAPGDLERPERRDPKDEPGVLVRLPAGHALQVEFVLEDRVLAMSSMAIAAPDFSDWFVVPIERAALVEAKHTLTFEEGMLKSAQTVRPSSALAVVSVPIDVGKAILSVPAELIQLKVDTTTKEVTLEQQQQALEKLKLQQELDDLKRERDELADELGAGTEGG